MVDTFHSHAFFDHSQTILVGWCRMMLAYKVHKPMWKEDWGMSKLLKRVVVRYGARICAIAAMVATISPVCCRGQWYQPEEPDGISEIKREME